MLLAPHVRTLHACRSIIAASVDGTVRCFDLRAGACYTDELGHPVASMALSHDGHCLLAACLDSKVRLLDRQSGELLATYQGKFIGSCSTAHALARPGSALIAAVHAGA